MSFTKTLRGIAQKTFGSGTLSRLLLESSSNGRGTKRGLDELVASYNDTPPIHAPMARIGNDIAAIPWQVFKISKAGQKKGIQRRDVRVFEKDSQGQDQYSKSFMAMIERGDLERVQDHDILHLLERPNDRMPGWMMMKLIAIYIKHVGEVFLLKEKGAQTGKLRELWVVPPQWVNKLPTKSQRWYELTKTGIFQRKVPVAKMIHIYDPDPVNPYGRGTSASWALNDEIDIDNEAAKFVQSRFRNGATPDLLIGVEGAHEEDLKEAKKRWMDTHRGARKAGQTHWHSGKLHVEQLTPSMQELQLLELRTGERNIILQTIGIPPETMGIIENSNRSTIDAADYFYTKRTLVPILAMMQYYFQWEVLPEVDPENADGLIVAPVNPVPEDKEHQRTLLKTAPQILTVNEWRGLVNHPPLEGEEGEELYQPKVNSETSPGGGDDQRDDEDRNRDRENE